MIYSGASRLPSGRRGNPVCMPALQSTLARKHPRASNRQPNRALTMFLRRLLTLSCSLVFSLALAWAAQADRRLRADDAPAATATAPPKLPPASRGASPQSGSPKAQRVYSIGHSFHVFMPNILTQIAPPGWHRRPSTNRRLVDRRLLRHSALGRARRQIPIEGHRSSRASSTC